MGSVYMAYAHLYIMHVCQVIGNYSMLKTQQYNTVLWVQAEKPVGILRIAIDTHIAIFTHKCCKSNNSLATH